MIRCDEDALICDFAQSYHIYDYRALPTAYAATLACGLEEDSRIKRKLSGCKLATDTMLLAAAVDRLSLIWWGQTRDGQRNARRPESVLDLLRGAAKGKDDIRTFASGSDFRAARLALMGGTNGD